MQPGGPSGLFCKLTISWVNGMKLRARKIALLTTTLAWPACALAAQTSAPVSTDTVHTGKVRTHARSVKTSAHPPAVTQDAPHTVPALKTAPAANATVPAAVTPTMGNTARNAVPAAENISVTGLRRSIQQDIALKRRANAVVDVITAQDVGRFPNLNVAEAMAHLPGVSVDHLFGEGEKVSINGTDPALNRIFIDGHDVASADWGGNPNDPTSRSFNYSFLAPDVINTLEVYKSSEARLDEGSLGGTVIVKTRKPLDMKANTAMLQAGWLYNSNSGTSNPKGSALWSWHNKKGTFGIMLSGAYQKENLARAGAEFFGYASGSAFSAYNPTITGGTSDDLKNARYPAGINAAYFQQQRERQTYQATAQWRPTEELQFTLSGMVIHGNYTNYNQSEYIDPTWAAASVQSVTVKKGLVTNATFGQTSSALPAAELDSIYRKDPMGNYSINFAPQWDHGPWHLKADAGYTRAVGGADPYYMLTAKSTVPFSYSFTGKSTSINYAQSPTDPATFSRNGVTTQTVNGQQVTGINVGGAEWDMTYDKEVYGQFSMTRDLNISFLKDIQFGAKYVDHDNLIQASSVSYYANDGFNLGDLNYVLTPNGIFDGLNISGNGTQYASVPKGEVEKYLSSQQTIWGGTDFGASEDVREQIAAGFAQLDFEGHRWRGNLGIRLAETVDNSSYFTTEDSGLTYTRTTSRNAYFRPLPALNLSYDVTHNLLARFSAAEVIARSRYADLAGALTRDDQSQTASGGNPNLKPYQALNLEGSLEWYFGHGDLLAIEGFYRDISNYVLDTTHVENMYNRLRDVVTPYQVTSPINAGGAKVYGFSPSLTWQIWNGFGVRTNYTMAFSDTGANYNMPFLSRHNVTFSPFYEKGKWMTTVNLNYRSNYFNQVGRLNSKDMTAGYMQLDYTLSYNFYKNAVFTFNAQNLLNETYYQYSTVKDAPTAFYKNGRSFNVNISYRF